MSLTFIDPPSENFAYLSPVIYWPSGAQLVFNTLRVPCAPHRSAPRGEAATGPYFIARPCGHRRLPETRGHPPPAPATLPGPRHTLTEGQGGQGGHGPSGLLLLPKAQLQAPRVLLYFPTTTRQLPADHAHVAEGQHPHTRERSVLFPPPKVSGPRSPRRWALPIQVPNSHSRRTRPGREPENTARCGQSHSAADSAAGSPQGPRPGEHGAVRKLPPWAWCQSSLPPPNPHTDRAGCTPAPHPRVRQRQLAGETVTTEGAELASDSLPAPSPTPKALGGALKLGQDPTGRPLEEPAGMAASPAPPLPASGPGNQRKQHALPLFHCPGRPEFA